MNNVIIFGKVISKSSVHFDYMDKLKAYFKISVLENDNIFEIVVSERYIETCLIDELYNRVSVNSVVCVCGIIQNIPDMYNIIVKYIYIL